MTITSLIAIAKIDYYIISQTSYELPINSDNGIPSVNALDFHQKMTTED